MQISMKNEQIVNYFFSSLPLSFLIVFFRSTFLFAINFIDHLGKKLTGKIGKKQRENSIENLESKKQFVLSTSENTLRYSPNYLRF